MHAPARVIRVDEVIAPDARPPVPDRPGKPVDAARLRSGLRRHRRWVYGILVAGAAGATLVPAFVVKPEYRTRAVVAWKRTAKEPLVAERELGTLVDTVKLSTNLVAIRRRVQIEWPVSVVGEHLDVSFDRESDVISIEASARSAGLAADLANAAADEFVWERHRVERDQRHDALLAARRRVRSARRGLARARARYERFRREHDVSDLPAQREASIERMAEVRARLHLAESARPNPDSRQPAPRPEEYERLLAAAASQAERLNRLEGEASALLSPVRVTEANLEEAQAEAARARDAASVAPDLLQVVAYAPLPELPARDLRRPVALLILAGTALLLVAVTATRELWGLRAWTPREIAFWADAPVLGSTTFPTPGKPLPPLVSELGDQALEGGGTTLIAGLGTASDLARHISQRLRLDTQLSKVESSSGGDATADTAYFDPEEPATLEPPRSAAGLIRQGEVLGPRFAAVEEGQPPPRVRRAARRADRLLLVVRAGEHRWLQLRRTCASLRPGPGVPVALLVIGERLDLAHLPGRVGHAELFWQPPAAPRHG